MTEEPLTIDFSRTGGGLPELRRVFRDVQLEPDDDRAWLGTERPFVARRHLATDGATYRLVFRRGAERRVVTLAHADLDSRLRSLVDRLASLAERR